MKVLISGFPSLAFWHDLIAHVSNTCVGTTIETHIPAPVSFKQMGGRRLSLLLSRLLQTSTSFFNPSFQDKISGVPLPRQLDKVEWLGGLASCRPGFKSMFCQFLAV